MPSPKGLVWIVCSNRWNSAITEYALSTALALFREGFAVRFHSLSGSPAARRAQALGLPCQDWEAFSVFELFAWRRIFSQDQPLASFLFGGPETFLARLWPKHLCIRFRGQDSDHHAPLSSWQLRVNLSHCDAVLVPSQLLAKRFQSSLPRTKVFAIPLGVDEVRMQLRPEALPQKGERPILTILGRFDPIKGHEAFLRIFRQCLDLYPPGSLKPQLWIVGEAANIQGKQLMAHAAALDLLQEDDVRIIEQRWPDVPSLLSRSSLGVISSLGSEVICRVAEEFLLCGTRLFVSGVGSLPECLLDQSCGVQYFALPLEQSASLLQSQIVQSQGEGWEEKQDRSRLAQAEFSLSVMGRRLGRVLEQLCGKNKRS